MAFKYFCCLRAPIISEEWMQACNLLMVDDCFVQPQPTTNINPFLFARTSPVWISGVSNYFVDDSGKVFKHVIDPPPTEK